MSHGTTAHFISRTQAGRNRLRPARLPGVVRENLIHRGSRAPEASATELLTQNPVLLDQVLDNLLLAPIDPPGDG